MQNIISDQRMLMAMDDNNKLDFKELEAKEKFNRTQMSLS
jgi:hypothetical protein